MQYKGTKLYIMMSITFVIVFLMNFIGSDAPDRLKRALLTAFSGAVFLAVGLFLMNKFGKDKEPPQNFD